VFFFKQKSSGFLLRKNSTGNRRTVKSFYTVSLVKERNYQIKQKKDKMKRTKQNKLKAKITKSKTTTATNKQQQNKPK